MSLVQFFWICALVYASILLSFLIIIGMDSDNKKKDK